MVGSAHPTVYRLIENFQLEQSLMETRKARMDAGQTQPLYSRVVYRTVNQRLQTVLADYQNRERIEFLRSCSYNFNFYRELLDNNHMEEDEEDAHDELL